MLRSPNLNHSSLFYIILTTGKADGAYPTNPTHIRPICVIKNTTTYVTSSVDGDGCYKITGVVKE